LARKETPDPLTRRHLLEKSLDPSNALRIAEAYLAEGRRSEAVPFLQRARATAQLESLAADAMADGDMFLFKAACAALEREPTDDEWRATADAAEAAGKLRYAATARRQIESNEG